MNINEKVFREVMGPKVKDLYKMGSNSNLAEDIIPYSIRGNGDLQTISARFFTQGNCKDWARTKGYWLHSHGRASLNPNGKGYTCSGSAMVSLSNDIPTQLNKITKDTEEEAIIEMVKWIMERENV